MLRSFIEYAVEKQTTFKTCQDLAREWSADKELVRPEDCR